MFQHHVDPVIETFASPFVNFSDYNRLVNLRIGSETQPISSRGLDEQEETGSSSHYFEERKNVLVVRIAALCVAIKIIPPSNTEQYGIFNVVEGMQA